MDVDLKLKALRRLAQSTSDAAEAALTREVEKVMAVLKTETQYDTLKYQIEILNAIGYRVHDRAAGTLISFIHRLSNLELTYTDQYPFLESDINKYQNSQSLTIDAIDTLVRLGYLESESVLDALLELSLHDADEVRKKAIEGLDTLAKYEITVFYGNDEQDGIGPAPQELIIEKFGQFGDRDLRKYFNATNGVSTCLLSPTMETTSSTYKTVTWTSAAVPALSGVADIRHRSIGLLIRLYGLTETVTEKFDVIRSLGEACRTHRSDDYGIDVKEMITRNSVEVLQFFRDLIAIEELPVIQKIERKGYWTFYHALNEEVENAARAIEAVIAGHAEYQIYKDLIGFNGIFGDWKKLKESEKEWDKVEEHRKRRASEYAQSITAENFEEWRERILIFAQTESNDLATFPTFYQLLREFAEAEPKLALDLVSRDSARIDRFLIPLLRGLWVSNEKSNVHSLIDSWIQQGEYLYPCTKMFFDNDDLDTGLLNSILVKAQEIGDTGIISMVAAVAVSNYNPNKKFLITDFFKPAIEGLTALADTNWVFDFWYRKERKALIHDLDQEGIDLIVENLIHLESVDYDSEEILYLIAERAPDKILTFFQRRLMIDAKGRKYGSRRFDAIPYELHNLKEPLSKDPEQTVQRVRTWYDGNYGVFMYRGGRLLHTIFPGFPRPFETALLKLVGQGSDADIEFVLAILRNYNGQLFVHGVCKEIINTNLH